MIQLSRGSVVVPFKNDNVIIKVAEPRLKGSVRVCTGEGGAEEKLRLGDAVRGWDNAE